MGRFKEVTTEAWNAASKQSSNFPANFADEVTGAFLASSQVTDPDLDAAFQQIVAMERRGQLNMHTMALRLCSSLWYRGTTLVYRQVRAKERVAGAQKFVGLYSLHARLIYVGRLLGRAEMQREMAAATARDTPSISKAASS